MLNRTVVGLTLGSIEPHTQSPTDEWIPGTRPLLSG